VVDEMKIFIEAGFSIEEAVRCATFNGAQLLGIKDLDL
jgi:imidazolonepropionase-like amidohydrolase